MSPLAVLLREEIRRNGPISFHRFMEAALYHPEYGYYRRDPFGKGGDFYTAEQLQPVFGILIAARIRALFQNLEDPPDFTVVELGAGRQEMSAAFAEWRYLPIDLGTGSLPERFRGVVFANEFFDALPVRVATYEDGLFREMLVGLHEEQFVWLRGDRASAEVEAYLRRYFPPPEQGRIFEVNLAALGWLERVAEALESGYVFTIDYGYTRSESIRFPRGTLMSYRRHTAGENVLGDPGEKDITAHLAFTALEEHGAAHGLESMRFETLTQTLLAAGEPDQFRSALAAATPEEGVRRRLQLKTLLCGLGQTFRTLLQRKEEK